MNCCNGARRTITITATTMDVYKVILSAHTHTQCLAKRKMPSTEINYDYKTQPIYLCKSGGKVNEVPTGKKEESQLFRMEVKKREVIAKAR